MIQGAGIGPLVFKGMLIDTRKEGRKIGTFFLGKGRNLYHLLAWKRESNCEGNLYVILREGFEGIDPPVSRPNPYLTYLLSPTMIKPNGFSFFLWHTRKT